WLSGTASSIASWARSTINNIVSWAQEAWNTIKSLASAVGQEVSGWFGATKTAISNTYQGMAKWVSNNRDWLVPVTAGVLVVGTAALTLGTGGAAAPALAAALVAAPVMIGANENMQQPTAAYATGGIVDFEHVARVGEGG